jgi:hypothetical protein
MTVVEKVLQRSQELPIEIFNGSILIDVQVQEMAECVMIGLEFEYCESFFQGF